MFRHTPSPRPRTGRVRWQPVRLTLDRLEDRATPALFVAQSAQTFNGLSNNGCVAAGDFNGDGKTDIVVTNYGTKSLFQGLPDAPGATLTVLTGQGTGGFASPVNLTVGSDQHVAFVTVADVNHDTKPDLVCVSASATEVGYLTVFLNDGSGGFTKKSQVTTGGSNSAWVGVAQLTDGDTDPDVLVCSFGKSDDNGNNVSGNNVTIFQGDGKGGVSLINTVAAGLAFIPTAGAIADFDGDGHQDVALCVPGVPADSSADQPNGSVYLFTGNGGGGFVQGNTFDSGGPLPIGIQAADLNADGKADLVVANAGNPDSNSFYANFGKGTSVGVLVGGGNGNFNATATYTAGLNTGGSTAAFAVAVADFNQDGSPDVAAIVYGQPLTGPAARVAVYKGDGAGNLIADPGSPFTTAATGGQYLAVGDFDGKGTPDLVTVGDSNKIVTLLNQTVPAAVTTTALASSLNPSTYGDAVTFTATVTAGAGTPTGTVSFFDGAAPIGTPVTLDASGKASVTTSTLPAFDHTVTAKYTGAAGFAASTSAALTQSVHKADPITTLAANPTAVPAGGAVTLTATVIAPGGPPTGPVYFFAGTTQLGTPVALVPGSGQSQAVLVTTDIPAGVQSITALYAGNSNLTQSTSAPVTVTVSSPAVGTTVALVASSNPSEYGTAVTFTATVTAGAGSPTGTVSFFDGGTQIGGPVALSAGGPFTAAFTTSTLGVGPHVITAAYSGAAGFNPSTSPAVNQAVSPTATVTTVATSGSPAVVTQAVTLTATVTATVGTPAGSVQFFDGATAISGLVPLAAVGGAQQAGFTTSTLGVGPHTITAQFVPGVGTLAGSTSAPASQAVNKAGTTIAVTSPGPAIATQPVTLTATITEQPALAADPGGFVTFRLNGAILATAPLAGGVATYTTTALPVGADAITAEFAGDATFTGSTSAAYTQTVNRAATTVVVTSPGPAAAGQPVTLTATVTGVPALAAGPTGTVTFLLNGAAIGTAPVAGGTATYTITTLAPGANPITAKYAGDARYAGNTSPPYSQQVTATGSTTVLTSTGPAVATQTVTLTATVTAASGTAAGSVQFFDGATAISGLVPLAAAGAPRATFSTSALAVGSHVLTAQFISSGQAVTGSTSAPLTQVVGKATPVVSVAPVGSPPVAGQPVTFAATVAKPNGVAADPGGTVTFLLNGAAVGTAPVVNGVATLTTQPLPTGVNTVTAQFAGDGNFSAATAQTVTDLQAPSESAVVIGYREFGVGAGAGHAAQARFFNPDGSERFNLDAFPGFTGGVRVTSADFNGDGIADLVAGTGPGSATHVRVLDGKTSAQLFAVDPFEATFTGGVYVATGDINGDGTPDLVISPDEGGGPRVRVFGGKDFGQIADFFGIDDPNFRGGARAGVADMNADGMGDLVVSAGFGGGPRVAAFDGKSLAGGNTSKKLFADFFAFEDSLRNGVYVAVGDVNGDGKADLIAGGGPGGGPRVTITDGAAREAGQAKVIADFFAGDPSNRGGVRLVARNLDGDSKADVVVGDGTGAGSHVTGYSGANLAAGNTTSTLFSFDAFPGFDGGVYVG